MQLERLTWATIKPTVTRVLNQCLTDSDGVALEITNRAIQRLMEEGNWVGTIARFRVCVSNGCVVWPRQIETVLAFAICNTPLPIFSPWYEFLGNGTYLKDDASCGNGWGCSTALIDRDEVASFDNVIGDNKRLAVYCDVTETTGAKIILQYYDNNGNWVRTKPAVDWIDGEEITFGAAGAYVLASKFCMANGYVRCIKPVTNGIVRLYEYDTVNLTYRPLAYYEPDETIPVYRRSLVPGLSISASEDCQKRSVTIMAKKRFIPLRVDNDFLPIGHLDAIRMAVMSIWKSENNLPAEASIYWNGGIDPINRTRIEGAIPLLQKQLSNYRGAGTINPIKMVNAQSFGAGGILQLT